MSSRRVSPRWWRKWRKEGLSHFQPDEKLAQLLGELESDTADTESDSEWEDGDMKREVKRKSEGNSTISTGEGKDLPNEQPTSSPVITDGTTSKLVYTEDQHTRSLVLVIIFCFLIGMLVYKIDMGKCDQVITNITKQNSQLKGQLSFCESDYRSTMSDMPKLSRRLTQLIEEQSAKEKRNHGT
jgi:hypothetical protein